MFLIWKIFGLISFALLSLVIVVYGGYYFYITKKKKKRERAPNGNRVSFTTRITVVIPTYNEETTIRKKLENLCNQTYPTNLMEIIVIDSDSKDDTLEIAKDYMRSHQQLNMRIIKENERKGKSEAINKAFSCASLESEILIMTDVDAILKEDAIEKVVSRFVDPEIGAVSGMQVLLNADETRETKSAAMYNHFWVKLRIGESAIDSTPIFSGELAAYRASLIRGMKLRENLNADDSQLAIMIRRKGYRSIRDPEAVYYEYAPPNLSSNLTQKVRRGQGLSRLFWYNKDMIFRKEYGKFGLVTFPFNFFAHVISPFIVFLSIIFGLVFFFFGFVYQSWLVLWVVLAMSAIFLLDHLLLRRKLMYVIWTFFEYQMILLKGILLFLFGTSLHKWQKVESIRTKFRSEASMN
jgi:cellulose synthase/poly-beta-1,6-N-acetylglucosamine synthase-like glycosyltransferase